MCKVAIRSPTSSEYQHSAFYRLDAIPVTNQPTPGFLTNTTTPPQAVWPYSSGCSLRGPLVRYEHPPIASLLIGATQEADLVSPGFEQSRAISNCSTLDFTLHCGEQRIVLPGDASWKWLCSSSVPPDDGIPTAKPTNSVNRSTEGIKLSHKLDYYFSFNNKQEMQTRRSCGNGQPEIQLRPAVHCL